MSARPRTAGGAVVVGPWPGSTTALRRPTRVARRPIPHHYYADKWGTRVLMDYRDCRTPFAPDVEVPRDRLCARCRQERHDAAPPLIEICELSGGGGVDG
ncbi:hypothetical protein IU501_34505 [Nocardia otitidiscaviarum]|uniref:hypothetical protein n=1 Tax=Nocardia otitidiscaviarum TaxID=1823 RepID=UPI0018961116|nr:hypothetical protein [Nocardia otitidiscaviarum]MBF6138082.1 hypothetical protein [Nocardia otitidiscaviarum]